MVTQMRMNKNRDHKRWVPKEGKEISMRLSNLAFFKPLRSLKSLRIKETFLELPPEQSEDDACFQKGSVKLEKLQVVNNETEKEVAMISAFNNFLTKELHELSKRCFRLWSITVGFTPQVTF